MPKDLNMQLLLDIYGSVLTERQRETMEYYYEDDLSLGEISEETGITRQGVFNCIKKSEQHLSELEKQLGIAERFRRAKAELEGLEAVLYGDGLTESEKNSKIEEKLSALKSIL